MVISSPERIPLLESEVKRLENELSILERQWNRKHLLALFALAGIPAYFLFGGLVAFVVVMCTPVLIGVQSYLLWVRRGECRQLMAEARRDLELLRHAST